eukprot:4580228-Pleurochrysis_carterae.AAC.1
MRAAAACVWAQRLGGRGGAWRQRRPIRARRAVRAPSRGEPASSSCLGALSCVTVCTLGACGARCLVCAGKQFGRLAGRVAADSCRAFLCAHSRWLRDEPEEVGDVAAGALGGGKGAESAGERERALGPGRLRSGRQPAG